MPQNNRHGLCSFLGGESLIPIISRYLFRLKMSLSFSQLRILSAAQGYCELGMFPDAKNELENIDPKLRDLPMILSVRLQIHAGTQEWHLMQAVARRLIDFDPKEVQWIVSWAYATRRVESIIAAKEILLEAVNRFPDEAILHYNLGCYEAQLGDSVAALQRLAECFRLDGGFRNLALDDEDLKLLWKLIDADIDEEA